MRNHSYGCKDQLHRHEAPKEMTCQGMQTSYNSNERQPSAIPDIASSNW